MPWKNDLAKLKDQLKEGPPTPPPPAPKKVVPPAAPVGSIAEEDALFLSAMGVRRPQPLRAALPQAEPEVVMPPPAKEPEADFASAMSDLKGLKSLAPRLPQAAPAPTVVQTPAPTPAPQAEPAPSPAMALEKAPELPSLPEGTSTSPTLPARIHLAAGMAIEVDGHLDVRGHSQHDAIERLRDRLEDARYMHWRSLHVTLGPEAALHEGLQAFLEGKGAGLVHHYAQAPVPMGGTQAWILYLTV